MTSSAIRNAGPRRALALVLGGLAVLAAAVPATASAQPLQKGMWGPTTTDGVSQFPTYERLGVTIYQTALPWATVAPTRPRNPRDPKDGAYKWPAEIDSIIAEAGRHHMTVMLMLVGSPPWANGGRTSEYAPRRPADFAAFARAATRRYPAVRRWMIWGEPSRANNWKPLVKQPIGEPTTRASRKSPRRYARLLDAAYGQIKRQRKSNIVIGGNTYTTGDIRPIDWVVNMKLPDGRPPRMDLFGHNPFTMRKPSLNGPQSGSGLVDFSDLKIFDKLVQERLGRPRHKRVRLFLSEFTIPTGPDSEFNFYVNEKTQSQWITSAFKVARRIHADTLGWIHLRDDPPNGDADVIRGGLLEHDGSRKPGFYAFIRGGLTRSQRARERRAIARARTR